MSVFIWKSDSPREFCGEWVNCADRRQWTRRITCILFSTGRVDRKEQVLRRRNISYVKVQWSRHSEREATWELEEEMKQKYPQLFETTGMKNFEDEIL